MVEKKITNRLGQTKTIGNNSTDLSNFDLTDINLNGIDITNINFNNTVFNNVIASDIIIKDNKKKEFEEKYGYNVFIKDNKKFLLGPGLYFDKSNFTDLNLQSLNLNNCTFRNCNFTSVDFRKTNLSKCSLVNCNLTKAQFNFKTNFNGLKSNSLTYDGVKIINDERYKFIGNNNDGILIGPKVNLSYQDLSNLDLRNYNLEGVRAIYIKSNKATKLPKNYFILNKILFGPGMDLSNLNLENFDLSNRKLSAAIFNNSNLRNVNFENTDLFFSSLNNAYLNNANLTKANLEMSLIKNSVLYGANLKETKLNISDLTGTNIRNVNFENTNLIGATSPQGNIYVSGRYNGDNEVSKRFLYSDDTIEVKNSKNSLPISKTITVVDTDTNKVRTYSNSLVNDKLKCITLDGSIDKNPNGYYYSTIKIDTKNDLSLEALVDIMLNDVSKILESEKYPEGSFVVEIKTKTKKTKKLIPTKRGGEGLVETKWGGFSDTTTMDGKAVFKIGEIIDNDDKEGSTDSSNYTYRMDLNTSFTGDDNLYVRLKKGADNTNLILNNTYKKSAYKKDDTSLKVDKIWYLSPIGESSAQWQGPKIENYYMLAAAPSIYKPNVKEFSIGGVGKNYGASTEENPPKNYGKSKENFEFFMNNNKIDESILHINDKSENYKISFSTNQNNQSVTIIIHKSSNTEMKYYGLDKIIFKDKTVEFESSTEKANQEFTDIQDIEVLRGPQAIVYGVSSTGGIVNIETNKPQGSGNITKYLFNTNYAFTGELLTGDVMEVNYNQPTTEALTTQTQDQKDLGITAAYTADSYGVSVTYGVVENGYASSAGVVGQDQDTYTSFNGYYLHDDGLISISAGYELATGEKQADEETSFFVGLNWGEIGPGSAGIAVGHSQEMDDQSEQYIYEAYYSYPINDGRTITPAIFGGSLIPETEGDTTGVMVKTSFSF